MMELLRVAETGSDQFVSATPTKRRLLLKQDQTIIHFQLTIYTYTNSGVNCQNSPEIDHNLSS